MMHKTALGGLVAFAVMSALVAPAVAQQRDPAYASARAAGQIGEQPDGYLAIVGAANPTLQRLVDDINIKRRATYAERAKEKKQTLEAYAFTAGCTLIDRTEQGEKYQAPDGSWQTRTAAAPVKDSRCP